MEHTFILLQNNNNYKPTVNKENLLLICQQYCVPCKKYMVRTVYRVEPNRKQLYYP